MVEIRRAQEKDRVNIAKIIAEAFAEDFSPLCKNPASVAKAISSGIQIDRFWLACENDIIAAVTALADCDGRAVYTKLKDYIQHFGLFIGIIAKLVLKGEFEKSLNYPKNIGYIEFVAVAKEHRRKGLATQLIMNIISQGKYKKYFLDLKNTNLSALACYEKLSFREVAREKVNFPKHKGFSEKIIMQYNSKL